MFNEAVEMFLKYDLQEYLRKKYFCQVLSYMDYVLPVLIEGKHLGEENELQCVGSQSLHLYYRSCPQQGLNFVVFRNEQGKDLVILNEKRFNRHKVMIFNGAEEISDKIEDGYLEMSSDGKLVFDSKEQLRSFIVENRNSLLKKENTTNEILSGQIQNYILEVCKFSENDHLHVTAAEHMYDFSEILKVFDLFNTMLCGVSEHKNEEIPEEFLTPMDEVSALMEKLRENLK